MSIGVKNDFHIILEGEETVRWRATQAKHSLWGTSIKYQVIEIRIGKCNKIKRDRNRGACLTIMLLQNRNVGAIESWARGKRRMSQKKSQLRSPPLAVFNYTASLSILTIHVSWSKGHSGFRQILILSSPNCHLHLTDSQYALFSTDHIEEHCTLKPPRCTGQIGVVLV